MQDLNGKNALITGGSKGIGLKTAEALAREGVNIAITARNEETLKDALAILNEYKVSTIAIRGDVSVKEEVDEIVSSVVEEFGTIDILINNAGIMGGGSFFDDNEEMFRQMLDVNVFGMYYTMKAVLPHMQKEQRGDVINIASVSGLRASESSALYSASKHAVIGLTEGVMREVRKDNIRMSYLTPSAVLTREPNLDPETMTHPEDIADIIVNQLKINPRTFVKNSEMWATNPQPLE